MQNIHEWRGKIKGLLDDGLSEWGTLTIVVVACLGSFGLGRLSAAEAARPIISVSQAPTQEEPRPMLLGGLLVGSRSGSTYHYPWCAGAAKITAQNVRWFSSEKEARAAGYVPAKNCKGLE